MEDIEEAYGIKIPKKFEKQPKPLIIKISEKNKELFKEICQTYGINDQINNK